MKNKYLGIIPIIILSLFFNCSDVNNLPKDYPDSGWIEFDTASSSGSQSSATIDIPYSLPIGTNESGQVITYSVELVSGDVPSNVLGTFTTTLPSGERSGDIAYNVAQSAGAYELKFTLLSSDNSEYQIGLSDGTKQITHNLFVQCPSNIGTTYDASVTAEDLGLTNSNNAPFDYVATLTQVDDNVYTIDSAWGPNFVAMLTGDPSYAGQFVYDGTITVNPDLSVTVEGSNPNLFTGGTGTYDPCTDTFTLVLTQGLFTGDFTVTTTLVGS